MVLVHVQNWFLTDSAEWLWMITMVHDLYTELDTTNLYMYVDLQC